MAKTNVTEAKDTDNIRYISSIWLQVVLFPLTADIRLLGVTVMVIVDVTM
jgi:hypothetical protein